MQSAVSGFGLADYGVNMELTALGGIKPKQRRDAFRQNFGFSVRHLGHDYDLVEGALALIGGQELCAAHNGLGDRNRIDGNRSAFSGGETVTASAEDIDGILAGARAQTNIGLRYGLHGVLAGDANNEDTASVCQLRDRVASVLFLNRDVAKQAVLRGNARIRRKDEAGSNTHLRTIAKDFLKDVSGWIGGKAGIGKLNKIADNCG